jgi:hypothetical protein
MVRISLGCYSDESDVQRAVDALERVASGDIAGTYRYDDHGDHKPVDYREPAMFTVGGRS